MSSKWSDDELLEEFERMLEAMDEEDDDEENGHRLYPIPTWGYSDDDDDEDSRKDTPPPIPKREKCQHKRIVKKHLFNSHYFECEDCGEEIK